MQDTSFIGTVPNKIRAGSTPGGIRIQGKELVLNLQSGTANNFGANGLGTPAVFALRPDTFYRLDAYGTLYEYYFFHKVRAWFISNQPTTERGSIVMCTEYDVKDLPPATVVTMCRNQFNTIANIYSTCYVDMIGSLSRLKRYSCQQDNGADAAQTTQAEVQMATQSYPTSSVTVGHIVIEYDIEFYVPC